MRAAALALLLVAATASADAGRCALGLLRASAKHAEAAAKVAEHCEDGVVAGRLPASTDCGADPALAAAATKLAGDVARACCGADGTCGTPDDDALATIAWTAASCPDLEHAGCDAAVASPGDVATCAACVGDASAVRLLALAAGEPSPAGVACRRAMGKEIARLVRTTAKALARCWSAREAGKHANPCPDPGDGRATTTIATARARAASRICAACGGADRVCGGGDDVPLAALGAPDRCPAVIAPDGTSCDAPIATVADLAGCLDCFARFSTGCVDQLAVPAFASYPATCNPPAGTCAAGVPCASALDCPAGYACDDNGGGARYCVGPGCTSDGDCDGGAVCRQYCTRAGCGSRQCQCPGFGCTGPDELCIDDGGLACRKLCTSDSDCTDPFGFVCVNPGFGFGVCIGQTPCQ